MNPQKSLFQKLIMPLMILIMILTGFLIFKNNPEIMSQRTLISVLKKDAQKNKMQFQTKYNNPDYLKGAAPTMTLPDRMIIRLKQDLFLPVSPHGAAPNAELSDFLYGSLILSHDSTTISVLSSKLAMPLWRFKTPPSVQLASGQLAVLGSEVIAATVQGGLYAFQLKTGRLLWYWQESNPIARMPLVYKKHIVLIRQMPNGKSWSIDLFDPDLRKITAEIARLHSPVASTPLVSGKLLILATQDGRLKAVDMLKRKIVWSNEGAYNFTCPPFALGRHIYICDQDGYILSYDRKTGRHADETNIGTVIESPLDATMQTPIAVGMAHTGDLVAFDFRHRKRLWRYPLGSVNTRLHLTEIKLTWESLRQINFDTTMNGWTVWTGCHVSNICVFDLKTGQLIYRFDLKHRLAGDFLIARDNLVWAPVQNGDQVGFERWREPKKTSQ